MLDDVSPQYIHLMEDCVHEFYCSVFVTKTRLWDVIAHWQSAHLIISEEPDENAISTQYIACHQWLKIEFIFRQLLLASGTITMTSSGLWVCGFPRNAFMIPYTFFTDEEMGFVKMMAALPGNRVVGNLRALKLILCRQTQRKGEQCTVSVKTPTVFPARYAATNLAALLYNMSIQREFLCYIHHSLTVVAKKLIHFAEKLEITNVLALRCYLNTLAFCDDIRHRQLLSMILSRPLPSLVIRDAAVAVVKEVPSDIPQFCPVKRCTQLGSTMMLSTH